MTLTLLNPLCTGSYYKSCAPNDSVCDYIVKKKFSM